MEKHKCIDCKNCDVQQMTCETKDIPANKPFHIVMDLTEEDLYQPDECFNFVSRPI